MRSIFREVLQVPILDDQQLRAQQQPVEPTEGLVIEKPAESEVQPLKPLEK